MEAFKNWTEHDDAQETFCEIDGKHFIFLIFLMINCIVKIIWLNQDVNCECSDQPASPSSINMAFQFYLMILQYLKFL